MIIVLNLDDKEWWKLSPVTSDEKSGIEEKKVRGSGMERRREKDNKMEGMEWTQGRNGRKEKGWNGMEEWNGMEDNGWEWKERWAFIGNKELFPRIFVCKMLSLLSPYFHQTSFIIILFSSIILVIKKNQRIIMSITIRG